tara:strand:- start:1603 stop:2016 length:414 start_codon:yes stop_codon:yes gene_type:complete
MCPQDNLFGWDDTAPEDVESKVCIKCGVDKALSCYSIANNNYLRTSCNSCISAANKVRNDLRAKVDAASEDHCCPICLKSGDAVAGHGGLKAGPWVLDHCHTSDEFRGWLCHNCNRALGLFKDRVDSLERAIDYLKS